MQQRVALARALAIEPRVLLLDEPLSALDAKVRVQLREEIRRIQLELGITTLYVTHDQEEALAISDHVAVMYGGRIEQMGTPREMYAAPATPFVAEFIGTMNRLESTVVDASAGRSSTAACGSRSSGARPARGERVLVLVRPESARARSGGERRRAGREHAERRSDLADVPRPGDAAEGRSARGRPDLRHVDGAGRRRCRSGARVTARVPVDDARLLSLPDEGVTFSAQDPDGQ